MNGFWNAMINDPSVDDQVGDGLSCMSTLRPIICIFRIIVRDYKDVTVITSGNTMGI